MAASNGITINLTRYLLGQAVVTSIQLMGQYTNEYYDMAVDSLAGAHRTWFSGGSGILSSGKLSPEAVLAASRVCALLAILTGIIASLHSPWMIPLIITSLLGAWFYSAPPLSLMSSGWGELTLSVVVALLVPIAGYCMQASFPSGELWLLGIPLMLIHTAMLISFEFPDRTSDQAVGKKTLTVRLGLKKAARLADILMGSAFLLLVVLTLVTNFPGKWMLLAGPVAIWQMFMFRRVMQSPTRTHYYLLTTGGVGLFVLTLILALLGFIFID